jgi:hypothetical protein
MGLLLEGFMHSSVNVGKRLSQWHNVVLDGNTHCKKGKRVPEEERAYTLVAGTGACMRRVSRTTESRYGRAFSSSIVGSSVETVSSSFRRRV